MERSEGGMGTRGWGERAHSMCCEVEGLSVGAAGQSEPEMLGSGVVNDEPSVGC